jgi:hypothetical protein
MLASQSITLGLGCVNVPGSTMSAYFNCSGAGKTGSVAVYDQPNCVGEPSETQNALTNACGNIQSKGSYLLQCGGSSALLSSGASSIVVSAISVFAVLAVTLFVHVDVTV